MIRRHGTQILAAMFCCVLVASAAEKKKVALTAPGTPYNPIGTAEIKEFEAYAPGGRIVAPDKAHSMEELSDADGVMGPITPETLKAAKKLQWVQVFSAGSGNAIITPHIAGRSGGEGERYRALFCENLRSFGAGERLIRVVYKQKGK